jgi:hypothetical protein
MVMPRMSKSSTTTETVATTGRLPPLHPGEVLREEFLVPLGLSAIAVARLVAYRALGSSVLPAKRPR